MFVCFICQPILPKMSKPRVFKNSRIQKRCKLPDAGGCWRDIPYGISHTVYPIWDIPCGISILDEFSPRRGDGHLLWDLKVTFFLMHIPQEGKMDTYFGLESDVFRPGREHGHLLLNLKATFFLVSHTRPVKVMYGLIGPYIPSF